MSYLSTCKDGGVLLRLYVQPKSSRNKFVGMHGDAIKLAITAPPVDGKANKAVVKFLAAFFKMKKKDFSIKHGLQSRTKSVLIAGVDLQDMRRRMEMVL
jgi:uncharacterized protein (TIGR00251 family)